MTISLAKTRDLEVRPRGWMVPFTKAVEARHMVVRARQATARAAIVVVDQPLVSRTVDVGRQLPKAGVKVVARSPHGLVRAVCTYVDWLRDADSLTLLAHHADAKDAEAYAKTMKAREALDLPRRRMLNAILLALLAVLGMAWWLPTAFGGVLAVVVFVGLVALTPRHNVDQLLYGLAFAAGMAWLAWMAGPWLASRIPYPEPWMWLALSAVAVPVLGWFGRHQDQPLVNKPTTAVPHKLPTITAPMVIDALCSLGNSKMKEPEGVRVIQDPHRAGAGVQLDLECPKGVAASWIVQRRESLAAAMRWPLGCVWPAVGPRHPGHFRLYMSDLPIAESPQKPWPLAEGGKVDIFRPLPLVTDQRGDWCDLVLAYAAMVIGAQPRMGKTFFLRECLLAAGLDPRTKVAAFDGKGTGDLSATRLFADFYSVGDDPEEIEGRVLPFLRSVRDDMRKRAKFIRDLPHEEAPESKVTSELVNQYPRQLAPWVIGIDETQSYFGYGDKKNKEHRLVRDEITAIITDLVKRGPALGIWVMLATQNVSEETIPRPISLNAVIRAALKLFDDSANNMVLGSGAYGKGVDATQFDFSEKGLMWLRSDDGAPFIGRSVVGLDAVAAERMGAKARALRVSAGTLKEEAPEDEVVYDIVEDAEWVMRDRGRGTAQWGELVGWLSKLREQYAALTEEELSASIRAANVRVRNVRSGDTVRKGVYISDLRNLGGEDVA